MLTIYKYLIGILDEQTILLPKSAKILQFANQNEAAVIWVLGDGEAEKEPVTFLILGSGRGVPTLTNLTYIGSAQFLSGELVWHLFRKDPG